MGWPRPLRWGLCRFWGRGWLWSEGGNRDCIIIVIAFIIVIIIPYYKGMGFSARLGLLGFGGASLESFDITREAKYAFPPGLV